jgi:hypothetical protein
MSLESRDVEGICGCLEALQMITPSDELAFRRVVTFLAIGMAAKNMFATVSALRLIGDVFAAGGDDATAASVLSASLHGFTLMDIHRQRARCMIRLGEIFGRCGQWEKSVEIWQKAVPLLERSSQAMDLAKIDVLMRAANECLVEEASTSLTRTSLVQ